MQMKAIKFCFDADTGAGWLFSQNLLTFILPVKQSINFVKLCRSIVLCGADVGKKLSTYMCQRLCRMAD